MSVMRAINLKWCQLYPNMRKCQRSVCVCLCVFIYLQFTIITSPQKGSNEAFLYLLVIGVAQRVGVPVVSEEPVVVWQWRLHVAESNASTIKVKAANEVPTYLFILYL